ncbi:MAG: alpha-amylase family protein [Bacteroidaceae bacterium]|nr:alpha-amylase family protein [Bacteroidaceae bacterium]
MNQRPIIYQVLPRLYGAEGLKNEKNGSIKQNGCGKLNSFTTEALNAIQQLGCNYIWYTGIIEHSLKTDYTSFGIELDNPEIVKGNAGSPYAIKDYYDVDPDLSVNVNERMKEFEALVRRTHKANLKVIIDFVPNHVARQYKSDNKPAGYTDLGAKDNKEVRFDINNNFYYLVGEQFNTCNINGCDNPQTYKEIPAKATGNNCFSSCPSKDDWYETVKLNYGIDFDNNQRLCVDNENVPDTWNKMYQILSFWANKGIDGFRCDMAEMVPCAFWGWVIPKIKNEHKDIIFIAEVYNPNEYRNYIYNGHFDYLYDKVGLYDTLKNVINGDSASNITYCWQSVDDIHDKMVNFLENHDEQRIASNFVAGCTLKGRPALLVSALMRNNPFMLYFGQELGEEGMDEEGFSGRDGRTSIFDYWTIDKIYRYRKGKLTKDESELRNFYQNVLKLCNNEDAIQKGSFFDLMYANYDNPNLNTNRIYTFIRNYKKDVIIVIANFDNSSADITVNIPTQAFEYCNIQPGTYKATDLLSMQTEKISLNASEPIKTNIPPLSGKVLKITI